MHWTTHLIFANCFLWVCVKLNICKKSREFVYEVNVKTGRILKHCRKSRFFTRNCSLFLQHTFVHMFHLALRSFMQAINILLCRWGAHILVKVLLIYTLKPANRWNVRGLLCRLVMLQPLNYAVWRDDHFDGLYFSLRDTLTTWTPQADFGTAALPVFATVELIGFKGIWFWQLQKNFKQT